MNPSTTETSSLEGECWNRILPTTPSVAMDVVVILCREVVPQPQSRIISHRHLAFGNKHRTQSSWYVEPMTHVDYVKIVHVLIAQGKYQTTTPLLRLSVNRHYHSATPLVRDTKSVVMKSCAHAEAVTGSLHGTLPYRTAQRDLASSIAESFLDATSHQA